MRCLQLYLLPAKENYFSMDNASAASLARFINTQSAQFSASVLDFTDRTWVLLRDSKAARTAPCEEPILDVRDYLQRLERRAAPTTELHALLELWLATWQEDALTDWQMHPPVTVPVPVAGDSAQSVHSLSLAAE